MASYFSTIALPDILNKLDGSPTSIDLLRLRGSSLNAPSVVEVDGTFQDNIVDKLATSPIHSTITDESSTASQPSIQILFLSSNRDKLGCTTKNLQVTRETLNGLCIHLGVNTTFLEAVLVPSIWSKQSCGSFERYDDEGHVRGLDGFYHYFGNWDLGPLHVWFTYDISTRATTYLLIDCPESVRGKIKFEARSGNRDFLLQPFAIDFLIAEACASWREVFANKHWDILFEWHGLSSNKMDPPIQHELLKPEKLKSLHFLLRTWNMLYEDLGDLSSRLEFLITNCNSLSQPHPNHSIPIKTAGAISALDFLLSRTNVRKRWVTSFGSRTKMISEFVTNLAAQRVNEAALENARENRRNSQVNVRIQGLTAKIAEETAKDNSSMITIATMTMLFLPGTFISAVFSMVFFNFSNGGSFDVSPWVWLYPAVTVPLTGLVFGWYQYWSRRREMKVPSQNGDTNGHAT